MEELVRCFIAIPVHHHQVKTFVNTQREKFESIIQPHIKHWLNNQDRHITLRFIGDVEPVLLPSLHNIIDECANREAFAIQLNQPTLFPGIHHARVLALQVTKNILLNQLVDDVSMQLSKLAIEPEDRQYRGHVTLARLKKIRHGEKLARLNAASVDYLVDSLALYQTLKQPGQNRYQILHQATLR